MEKPDFLNQAQDIWNKIESYGRNMWHGNDLAAELEAVRRRYEEQKKAVNNTDGTTGLPNRHLFLEEVNRRASEKDDEPFALLCVNLNRFHDVNEKLGSLSGDEILAETARRLEDAMPSVENRTIYRVDGNTFVVAKWDSRSKADAEDLCRKLLNIFVKPFRAGTHDVLITASVGGAHFPEDGQGADLLLGAAENAAYQANKLGENSFKIYQPPQNTLTGKDRLQLEIALRDALDNNEFSLEFQPQFDVKEHRVMLAEALLRWKSEKFGSQVSPADFVPVLYETGMIMQVGEWVLREAIAKCREWQARHPQVGVAVNMSAHQINHEQFANVVKRCVYEGGVPPESLVLDLRESSLMDNSPEVQQALTMLSDMGVRIALDDFGMEMTSFHRLKQLPVNDLKIDPSFIYGMDEDPRNKEMVGAMVAMGRALNVSVVGEGVETEEQMEFLISQGCPVMQGFLLCKPLDAVKLGVLLDKMEKGDVPCPPIGHELATSSEAADASQDEPEPAEKEASPSTGEQTMPPLEEKAGKETTPPPPPPPEEPVAPPAPDKEAAAPEAIPDVEPTEEARPSPPPAAEEPPGFEEEVLQPTSEATPPPEASSSAVEAPASGEVSPPQQEAARPAPEEEPAPKPTPEEPSPVEEKPSPATESQPAVSTPPVFDDEDNEDIPAESSPQAAPGGRPSYRQDTGVSGKKHWRDLMEELQSPSSRATQEKEPPAGSKSPPPSE